MPGEGLFHIGRLDKESEGLLLISNDGDFAQQLIHPRFQIEKEYLVTLNRPFEREVIDQLKRGVVLDDGLFKPLRVLRAGPERLLLVITDGRNRVIRRAIAEVGFKVTKLIRTRVGKYELGSLRPGKWRKIYN
jgi:23S rRNA pseudouridine2605 synthase